MRIIKKGSSKIFSIDEIFKYKNLIYILFLRNISTVYKQTILGPIWQVLNPLIQSLLFTLVFSKIAKLPTDDIPPFLFYSSAMLAWVFFQSTCLKVGDSFLNFAGLIRNSYIPKLTIVLSLMLENIFVFSINFVIFIALYIYFIFLGFSLDLNYKYLLVLPLVILYVCILGGSIGLIIACISAKFRDLRFVATYGLQIVFYVTPIVYSINSIPVKYHFYFYLNPLTFIIDYFRNLFFSTNNLDMTFFYSSCFIFLVIFYVARKLYINVISDVVDYV